MKLGILGTGQLATLLEQALPSLLERENSENLELELFSSPNHLHSCDAITFESENIDLGPLKPFAAKIVPSLASMRTLQDKLEQKKLLKKLNIPSSPYLEISGSLPKDDPFKNQYVLKWARFGYDGHGVLVVDPKAPGIAEKARSFLEQAEKNSSRVFAEAFAPFKRELAVVISRDQAGRIAKYPVVISVQDRGVCSEVYGPATLFGMTEESESTVQAYAIKIAEELHYVGTLAVELFELPNGDLWVNEIAPRVHNTGHYSIEAMDCSQFENHLRAVSGLWPVLQPKPKAAAFVMFNILGADKISSGNEKKFSLPKPVPGAALHWYGKAELRARRKMGHYTAVLQGSENLSVNLEGLRKRLRSCIQEWHQLT